MFPKDFMWGVATASYQIEGGALDEGRGECIWYRFSHTPGKVAQGDTGDVACDHLHRYKDDVALMRDLGLNAYRFSISWARVLPKGTGTTNPAGIDFYDRLVDELLRANIEPFLTLYHWDLPQALQDRGGWANPDSVQWFTDYADLVSRRLGDRVKHWMTLNEPWVIAFLGNWLGVHAPGLHDLPTAYRVAHHLLLAHGAAVPVLRQNMPASEVGITIDLGYFDPASSSDADMQAAWHEDGFNNRWFLDPIFKGCYPADIDAAMDTGLTDEDLNAVSVAATPIDFLGINYYTRTVIAADESSPSGSRSVRPENSDYTAMEWEIYPDGLRNLLVRVAQDYSPKAIYVTESGAAFDDPVPQNGVVEDPRRVAYLDAHFKAALEAIEQGVLLKGYFVWSLLDNFEWSFGYSKRFGIAYVDFTTQKRTPKRSALFYKDFIQRQHAEA
jgi:beta-glucosidase